MSQWVGQIVSWGDGHIETGVGGCPWPWLPQTQLTDDATVTSACTLRTPTSQHFWPHPASLKLELPTTQIQLQVLRVGCTSSNSKCLSIELIPRGEPAQIVQFSVWTKFQAVQDSRGQRTFSPEGAWHSENGTLPSDIQLVWIKLKWPRNRLAMIRRYGLKIAQGLPGSQSDQLFHSPFILTKWCCCLAWVSYPRLTFRLDFSTVSKPSFSTTHTLS